VKGEVYFMPRLNRRPLRGDSEVTQVNRGKKINKVKLDEIDSEYKKIKNKENQERTVSNQFEKIKQEIVGLDNSPPKNNFIPQTVVEDTTQGLLQAKEENYGDFRKDVKNGLLVTADILNRMVLDLQTAIEKLKNDPIWVDVPIGIKVKQLESLTNSLMKISTIEREWSGKDDPNKNNKPSIHLHYNMPTDPAEMELRLEEYDRILGKHPGMLPAVPPGYQQRILVETKPVVEGGFGDRLQIGTGKQKSEENVEEIMEKE
jgi:IS4 transposase